MSHRFLVKYIEKHPPQFLKNKTIIEIGCTREVNTDSKGFVKPWYPSSTPFLSKICVKYGMNLISVDMDPEVIKNVIKMGKQEGLKNHKCYAMKGEEFLKNYNEKIDFIYLDAFDFYHKNHAAWRYERYKKYMNCTISNELCWKMHLECCENIIDKLQKHTIICFDDILNHEATAGKGVLAVPYLRKSGKVKEIDYIPPSKETGQGALLFTKK